MPAPRIPILTVEAYLAAERSADSRHEYYAGGSYAVAGGAFTHALLISNLCGEMRNALRDKACREISSELLFRSGAGRLYAYPEVLVFCGPVVFADDRKDVVLNPIVVAEVLSPGTEAFDRRKKAAESVQQYLLVSQDEALLEVHTRDEKGGRIREVRGLDGVCVVESLGLELGMAWIYEGVELAG
jgi:Uma2 family endonuclease